MTRTLFSEAAAAPLGPLADRLRPKQLNEVVGQDHVMGTQGQIGRMLASGHFASLILWGPPGCGKTTLARLLADASGYELATVSAVSSGVADLKKIFETARIRRDDGRRTLLFVDEVHRFNRAQQDAFLPVVEDGTITLVGATTENPSFELNAALLSRCKVVVLKRLDDAALEQLIGRAEQTIGHALPLQPDARGILKAMADGDGRFLLNMVEDIIDIQPAEPLDEQQLIELVQRRAPVYDKSQESHYNLISALHKSMRGSDVQASLYWLCRMLEGGEDPLYIARRMVRMAIEDVGLADPEALHQCLAAKDTYDFLGSPEGELALVQAMIYLATAPKSNAGYKAYGAAKRAAKAHGSLMPPKYILNAPTKLMKQEGYGGGYEYDHDAAQGFSGQNYFPEEMERENFYNPRERGFEREIRKRLDYWDQLRKERQEKA